MRNEPMRAVGPTVALSISYIYGRSYLLIYQYFQFQNQSEHQSYFPTNQLNLLIIIIEYFAEHFNYLFTKRNSLDEIESSCLHLPVDRSTVDCLIFVNDTGIAAVS